MSGKRVGIVQSSYIPWKGYFDLVRRCDEFILYDDAQFTRRDWRNRNRIKTKDGPHWLTIPVEVKGRFDEPVKSIRIDDPRWNDRHFKTIASAYARAAFFRDHRDELEELFRGATSPWLSEVNRRLLEGLARMLGIQTRFTWSMDYELPPGRIDRLVAMCRQAGGAIYWSGPTARSYIDPICFERAGVELRFIDYDGYPEYPQVHPPFDHFVSIVDLILNVGAAAAASYMLP